MVAGPKRRLSLAKALYDDSYAAPVGLDTAAAAAGLSKFHFVRAFHAAYGVTPHRYLTTRRLDAAKQLLRDTGRDVTEVCFDVGFESLGSFSSLFRRSIGLSPRAYRLGHRALYQALHLPAPPQVPSCLLLMLGGARGLARNHGAC